MVDFCILKIKWPLLFYFQNNCIKTTFKISNLIKRGNPAIKMEKLMRKSFIKNLTYCILMVLLLTGFGFAANTLEVKCVDENGQPVEKVKVLALALKNNKTSNKNTDKDGIGFFNKMKDDYYRVWIEAKGYKKEFKEFIPLLNDNTQAKVEFVLQPGNEKDPLYFEDNLIIQRAEALYSAGNDFLQKGNLEEAEARLAESVEIYPSQVIANNDLAFVYFNTFRIEEAKACYESVINIAETFKYLEGDPDRIALYDQQIQHTLQLLENLPLQILAAETDKALKSDDFETAVEKLDQLIGLQPENAGFYFEKALALNSLGKLDESEISLNKAIELNPSENTYKTLQTNIELKREAIISNQFRASLLEVDELNSSGEYEKALSSLVNLEADTPDDLRGAFCWIRGRAYRGLDQKDEMIQSYEEALQNEKDSKNQGVYLDELTNWLLDKNYLDELLDVYPRVASITSTRVTDGLSAIAGRLIRTGDQASARTTFEKILEIDPENAEAYYELGMNYFYEVKDEEKARVLLDKYIEIGKDNSHLDNAKNVIAVMATQQ